jgi:hypothetical protein
MISSEEILLMIAELAQDRGIKFHIENYQATRSAAERLLRTMSIIPNPKAIAGTDITAEYPLYRRGVTTIEQKR